MRAYLLSRHASHVLFVFTLITKGLPGLVQLACAVAVYLGMLSYLPGFMRWFVDKELSGDPAGFLASRLLALTAEIPTSEAHFYTIYFAAHGALHLGVVIALLWGARWAYDAAVVVLAAFVVYQLVECHFTAGQLLLVLSAIDLAVIYLTLREKRERARHRS